MIIIKPLIVCLWSLLSDFFHIYQDIFSPEHTRPPVLVVLPKVKGVDLSKAWSI